MKELKIETSMFFCQPEELGEDEQRLIELAKKATYNSYTPYSHFNVGAAVRLGNGMEIIGANQENAAFPVTLCAERTAIFAAQAQHPDQPIVALAIAARNNHGFVDEPASPCGSCRQVILEVEQRYKCDMKILLYGTRGVYVINSIKDILPLYFVDESMR